MNISADGLAAAARAPRRQAGRPQDSQRGEIILERTLEILAERGYAGLTVDEVVARARVSKSTIYRRWPTKEELAVAAFDRIPELEPRDHGTVREDLLDLFSQYIGFLASTPLMSVLPALISEAFHNPALAVALDATLAQRRLPAEKVIARAIARGELPDTLNVKLVREVIMAPMTQRSLFDAATSDLEELGYMLDVILAGLRSVPPPPQRTRA